MASNSAEAGPEVGLSREVDKVKELRARFLSAGGFAEEFETGGLRLDEGGLQDGSARPR